LDVLFLDANVLFSAAYRPGSSVRRLWEISGVRLVTSTYAVEEARRNLNTPDQRSNLDMLLADTIVAASMHNPGEARREMENVDLPDKDKPIMLAAVDTGATHLITGDFSHFGPYYGEFVAGVLVLAPAAYLRRSSGDEGHDG
jgi:predicted nucleic acid-binding protein